MAASKSDSERKPVLSPHLQPVWGFITNIDHLVLATTDFIVWIDDSLDIDWKTRPEYDDKNRERRQKQSSILSRASVLESGDWDKSDQQKTLNLKRQIAEAIARSFEGDFANAEEMLDSAKQYRDSVIRARREAIQEQIRIRDDWKRRHQIWAGLHYSIGCAALLFSTLVAAKVTALGLSDTVTGVFAWLVAFLTGLLTFLSPDKKADKYVRAWSILNSQITRYNTNHTCTISDVLEACQRGESIIFESAAATNRRTRNNA